MRQVASDFSSVRGLTGYAVLLTTPPLTYQGPKVCLGRWVKKKIQLKNTEYKTRNIFKNKKLKRYEYIKI